MKISRKRAFSANSDSATFQLTILSRDISRALRDLLLENRRSLEYNVPPVFSQLGIERYLTSCLCRGNDVIGRWAYRVARRKKWLREIDTARAIISCEVLGMAQGRTSDYYKALIQEERDGNLNAPSI